MATAPTLGTQTLGKRPSSQRELTGFWARFNSPVVSFYLILFTTLALVGFGLVMVLSASSVELLGSGGNPYGRALNQSVFALMGVITMFVVSSVLKPKWLQRVSYIVMVMALGIQILVFVPGIGLEVNGNLNWIQIGPITGQPSEFVKLALCLWLGMFFTTYDRRIRDWWWRWAELLFVVGAAVGLVLMGKDLGTALIMMLIVFAAMLFGGVRAKVLVPLAVVALIGVTVLIVTSPDRIRRFTAFLNADAPVGDTYQVQAGLRGLAEGGYFGLGLGESRQKWSYLPEAETDFIFAIIGEEGGLVLTLLVLLAYILLAVGLHRLARQNDDRFTKIVTGTIMAWFLTQAVINVAVVVGWGPVIGLPLPLVSAGGSALLVSLTAIGVVLSFARNQPGAKEMLGSNWRKLLSLVPGWRKTTPTVAAPARGRVRLDASGRPIRATAPRTTTHPTAPDAAPQRPTES